MTLFSNYICGWNWIHIVVDIDGRTKQCPAFFILPKSFDIRLNKEWSLYNKKTKKQGLFQRNNIKKERKRLSIFYHVTMDLFHNGRFTPRIPMVRGYDENEVTPRVCVSSTVAGCFNSVPFGNIKLSKANNQSHGLYKLFKIDTKKLGIPDNAIVTSEELYQRNEVCDAYWTEETWITVPFVVPEEDTDIIILNEWESDEVENVPYEIRKIAEEHDDLIENVWNEKYGYSLPFMIHIEEVYYDSIMDATEFTLYATKREFQLLEKELESLNVKVEYTPHKQVEEDLFQTELEQDVGVVFIDLENKQNEAFKKAILNWKKQIKAT